MDANDYQKAAARTLIDKPDFQITDEEIMLVWNAIGLAGEAGEVAESVKKAVFHQQGIDHDRLIKELGDVCWYLAGVCTTLGVPLGSVMQTNVDKLLLRFPNGWDHEDSARKMDERGHREEV